MVQVVDGSPNCDVDSDRSSLELPTNHESVVVSYGFDLDVYDGSLHTRMLEPEKV
jgi:hypothetical protein